MSNKTEVKNVIASSFFILDDFNNVLNRLLENLKYETYNDDIHIIIVSWLSTITLNEKIEIREIKYVNAYNNEKKIIIKKMSYPTFLKNINIISDSISDLEKKQ